MPPDTFTQNALCEILSNFSPSHICYLKKYKKNQVYMAIFLEMSSKMLLVGIICLLGFFNDALIPAPVTFSHSGCHLQAS